MRPSTSRAGACSRTHTSRRGWDVAWHGGEPLACSAPLVRGGGGAHGGAAPGLAAGHALFSDQRAAADEDRARFFARTGAKVGLSIDGPADLHDACRRTRHGQGTHAKAMCVVRLLRDQGLAFHVITVLTRRALEDPDRLFDFYVENGIKEVGFNIEEIEGENAGSSLGAPDIETKFRRFIKRFFELVWKAPHLLKVRELESAIGHLLSDEPVQDEQNLPFAIVSVGHDGTISTSLARAIGRTSCPFRRLCIRKSRHASLGRPRARGLVPGRQR